MDPSFKSTPPPHSELHPDMERPFFRGHTSESVFRPVNPWKMTLQECLIARHSTNAIRNIDDVQPNVPMYYPTWREESEDGYFISEKKHGKGGRVTFGWWSTIITFLTDWLPRRIFINLLFHIPSIYMSRIEKTFNEAGESLVDLKRRALDESSGIEQPEVKTFELRLVPIHVGRYLTFDLASPCLIMLLLISASYRLSTEAERLDLVLLVLPALFSTCGCAAVWTWSNSHDIAQRGRIAAWNFNVALNIRGIHQSFLWNICVDLSIQIVWTIWGYTFLALYWLRRWYLTKFTPEPLPAVIGFVTLVFVPCLGFITILFSWYYSWKYRKWGRVVSRTNRVEVTRPEVQLDTSGLTIMENGLISRPQH